MVLAVLQPPGSNRCLLILADRHSPAGWLFVNLFLFEFCLICTILPHEIGHALAARMLGWRVFHVIVGSGKTIYQKSILGFKVEFKNIPLGGLTVATPKDDNFSGFKHFVYIFAGPLVNLAMAAAGLLPDSCRNHFRNNACPLV